MKRLITYISHDNQTFSDKFACARHELTSQPELVTKIAEALAPYHISRQGNWCGDDPDERTYTSACACVGCANRIFYELDLEYAHWKVWFNELRSEQPTDNIPDINTDVDVIILNIGEARVAVFKIIRDATGLGVVETKNLMDRGPGVCIKREVDFFAGRKIIKDLEEVGCTARLVASEKQRWS